MRIGIPAEIKSDEFRVGLVPGSVRELVAHGHQVIVQSGAGAGIFADDAVYEKAGARIAASADAVFHDADMIVKVKEPQPVEWKRLRSDQILRLFTLGPGSAAGNRSDGVGRGGHRL